MNNAIGSTQATVSQWNYALATFIPSFVGHGVNLPGFTTEGQLATADQYIAALQAYQALGNSIPGLSGLDYGYPAYSPYWVPAASLHNPGVW